jgi:hypothetical protein
LVVYNTVRDAVVVIRCITRIYLAFAIVKFPAYVNCLKSLLIPQAQNPGDAKTNPIDGQVIAPTKSIIQII